MLQAYIVVATKTFARSLIESHQAVDEAMGLVASGYE